MKDGNALRQKIIAEAKRIEEDSILSFKGHFNAAVWWERTHLLLGCIAAGASTIAGASLLNAVTGNWIYIAGLLGLLAGIITAVSTFIGAHKKGYNHRLAGADYQDIRNRSRLLYEVKAFSKSSDDALIDELEKLREQQSKLSKEHPVIPPRAFKTARKGVGAGEARYQEP